jgi:hypothetical protein
MFANFGLKSECLSKCMVEFNSSVGRKVQGADYRATICSKLLLAQL